MRISDWSSDVCSSDLCDDRRGAGLWPFRAVGSARPGRCGDGCLPRKDRHPRLTTGKGGRAAMSHTAIMLIVGIALLVLLRLAMPDSGAATRRFVWLRSEEHTSELQSLMRISYAVFCLK